MDQGAGAARRAKAANGSRAPGARDVRQVLTRDLSRHVENLLWGRAAGRCEFQGCNRDLTRAPATHATRNLAEKAHIYAFSPGGPRADHGWPRARVNDVGNLLLVCHDCHVIIDREDGPDVYTAARLVEMKRHHEQRTHVATGIAPNLKSHVLTYGTFVGAHQALPTFTDAAAALFPSRVPATATMIELGPRTGSQRDHDEAFWTEQRRELQYEFDRQVRTPIERGEITHLSVFAIAPQPLLLQLGVLLGDITPVDTFQRHREPPTWTWPADASPSPIVITAPERATGVPALVLSVSAAITTDRITRVLGDDTAVWSVTVPAPNNDVVKARRTLVDFRQAVRPLFNRIKAQHGHATPVHVFPALPVSFALELGRVRMPKADAPWVLYDEQQSRGGFVAAFILNAEIDT